MSSVVAPILSELVRIQETVRARTESDDARVADLQHELVSLREEVASLRRAVAHLRCSAVPVPTALRPVVARAVLAAGGGAS